MKQLRVEMRAVKYYALADTDQPAETAEVILEAIEGHPEWFVLNADHVHSEAEDA